MMAKPHILPKKVLMATVLSLLTHMGLLMCHPATWRSGYSPPTPVFLPGPQFCPDTGKTVCAAVDYYPTERIYNLLTSTRSQVFNITSLFVDERKGDAEPNLSQVIVHPPYYQNRDSYYAMHPTPGGRFSPAGNDDNDSGGNRSGWGAGQNGNSGPATMGVSTPNRWHRINPVKSEHLPPDGSGPWRGPSTDYPSSDGYVVPKRAEVIENTQSWMNNDRSTGGLKPGTKNSVKNGVNAEIGRSFVQQQQVSDEDLDLFWQPKSYDDGQTARDINHQHRRPETNDRILRMQQQFTSPSPRQWVDPNGYRPSTPVTEQRGRGSVKRGRRTNMDVEGACAVRSTFIPPRAALNDQSEWKFIINLPERDQRFSQVVRVDLCLNEGEPCSSKLSLPFGFISRCRQKYIKKKLLSLNADGQGTAEDNFFIPSCCVCELVRSENNM